MLNCCDEAAEFDDAIDAQQHFDDDPSIVVFRKANKIGFFVVVTPEREDDIKVFSYCEIFLHIPCSDKWLDFIGIASGCSGCRCTPGREQKHF